MVNNFKSTILLFSFQSGNYLVYTKFYFLLATKTLHNEMDPISQTLKQKAVNNEG